MRCAQPTAAPHACPPPPCTLRTAQDQSVVTPVVRTSAFQSTSTLSGSRTGGTNPAARAAAPTMRKHCSTVLSFEMVVGFRFCGVEFDTAKYLLQLKPPSIVSAREYLPTDSRRAGQPAH